MRFGVREICNVVLKKKAGGYFGKLYIDKDMPVLYFDTLKTSSLEGASSTVYAQGGRGNPRLVAWDGDRTMTFTMEDALISPQSFSILSGAGFMNADKDNAVYIHHTEEVQVKDDVIKLSHAPATAGAMYVMLKNEDGSINTDRVPMEIPKAQYGNGKREFTLQDIFGAWETDYTTAHAELINAGKIMTPHKPKNTDSLAALAKYKTAADESEIFDYCDGSGEDMGSVVYVDYYVKSTQYSKQIDIEAGKFGGSYYLEADTLFRDENGEDYPAEFVIPNCKVQSNFTFTMAPTGDPSTFTFTMDAFPDYTKFDKTKKVLAALQIIEDKELYDGGLGADGEEATVYEGDIYEDSGKQPPKRFADGD